mmetsp:Transcript_26190/g.53379  ORF Transcript_26190/g.53379 Transcript_26190/m.53379 type:complete len:97 (+) Transcript_26190:722-1012(+)
MTIFVCPAYPRCCPMARWRRYCGLELDGRDSGLVATSRSTDAFLLRHLCVNTLAQCVVVVGMPGGGFPYPFRKVLEWLPVTRREREFIDMCDAVSL